MHPATVPSADKNEHVGNAIGKIVQHFAAPACLARCEGDHPIEHIAPKAQIAEQRRDDQCDVDCQKQNAAIAAAAMEKYEIASA